MVVSSEHAPSGASRAAARATPPVATLRSSEQRHASVKARFGFGASVHANLVTRARLLAVISPPTYIRTVCCLDDIGPAQDSISPVKAPARSYGKHDGDTRHCGCPCIGRHPGVDRSCNRLTNMASPREQRDGGGAICGADRPRRHDCCAHRGDCWRISNAAGYSRRDADAPTAYNTQANPHYGFGPRVRVQPTDVISGDRMIGRDPDPFIRGQILRNYRQRSESAFNICCRPCA